MTTHTLTELLTLLTDVRRYEGLAVQRMAAAEEERDSHGMDSTPLDAARIEYNRGQADTYRTMGSRLAAILNEEASRHASIADTIREARI